MCDKCTLTESKKDLSTYNNPEKYSRNLGWINNLHVYLLTEVKIIDSKIKYIFRNNCLKHFHFAFKQNKNKYQFTVIKQNFV